MIYRIYDNGEQINTIVASEEFCIKYCEKNGYTYEAQAETSEPTPEPGTLEDRVSALETAISDGLSLYETDLGEGV